MYEKITTNIVVDNVNEALDFYEGVLGFRLVMAVPENSQEVITTRTPGTPLGFALIQRDQVELMLQSRASLSRELPPEAGRPAGGSFSLYIQVADVRQLHENLRGRATVVKALHRTFYGAQEFYIRDSNGCILAFAGKQGEA
jgi:uncharacterized glyoxalase superfamily protein PhnB